MLRGRRAAIAAAFAIAAAAAVTAGCGGGRSGSQALSLDPVSAAATKTQDAGAARIRMTMALSGTQLQGKTLRIHMSGAVDGTSGELSFDLGSLVRQMGMPATAQSAVLSQLKHASLKEIFLEQNGDYVIYVRLGALSSQIPGGKHWVKLDVSTLGKSAGLDIGKLLSGSQLQPTDVLAMLKGEGAKVDNLGPASIGGEATTHYRATIDVAKALQAKGLASPLLGSLAAQMPQLPADVWIGKDGLVRRVRISYSLSQDGRRAHLGMTLNLFDYGAHVTIAAPPSNDVFDATQLAQQGIGSGLLH